MPKTWRLSIITDPRLARYFNTTPQSWLNLQKNYELEVAQRRVGSVIADQIEPRAV